MLCMFSGMISIQNFSRPLHDVNCSSGRYFVITFSTDVRFRAQHYLRWKITARPKFSLVLQSHRAINLSQLNLESHTPSDYSIDI